MSRNFEKLIEYIINNDETRARKMFHEIVVSKSRNIYESFEQMEMHQHGEEEMEEGVEDFIGEVEDEELTMEADMEPETADDDDDMDLDDDQGDDMEDRVVDLEDAIEELKAEFQELMDQIDQDNQDGDNMESDEESDEESDDESDEESDEEYEDMGKPVELAECARMVVSLRPTWLRRALRNLIDNALRYGGVARVSMHRDGKDLRIRIDDDGPGIPEADLGRMTDPFTRGDPSRNTATGGAGLGLALAHAIAEQHCGSLVLANRAEGGLRAEIVLPG